MQSLRVKKEPSLVQQTENSPEGLAHGAWRKQEIQGDKENKAGSRGVLNTMLISLIFVPWTQRSSETF